eukprot:TRINITY_DN607_c0_g1_i1.p1 TRINITY_DN607_c0_g1~~TRINITY_DN607_c0_g1_i1.p1  ORF type:complete len:137 (-),score=36.84 TRINITY_DN607_c0_g1_i1:110-469(-)
MDHNPVLGESDSQAEGRIQEQDHNPKLQDYTSMTSHHSELNQYSHRSEDRNFEQFDKAAKDSEPDYFRTDLEGKVETRGTEVFVGGLSKQATVQDLIDVFSRVGTIYQVFDPPFIEDIN